MDVCEVNPRITDKVLWTYVGATAKSATDPDVTRAHRVLRQELGDDAEEIIKQHLAECQECLDNYNGKLSTYEDLNNIGN